MYAKQGVTTFASNGLGYDPMTYSDHLQAKEDSGHGRFRVEWDVNTGLQIYVGWSWMDEEVLWVDAQGIRPTDAYDWTFGFSARNGGIDQDVFIDNLVITAVPAPGAAVALVGLAGWDAVVDATDRLCSNRVFRSPPVKRAGSSRTFVLSQFAIARTMIHPPKRQLTQANSAANTARIQRIGTLPVSPHRSSRPTTAPTAM